MKRQLLLVAAIVGMSLAFTASAGRNYTWEVGYFAADGVSMNGSVIYPCEGPPLVDGELVGTRREIWRESCLCAFEPCSNWPSENPFAGRTPTIGRP